MKNDPCSRRYLLPALLAAVVGLASEAGYAGPTPAELRQIRDVVETHRRHAKQMLADRNVVASGVGLDARGRPVIRVLVTDARTAVPARIEGVRVHKQVSGQIVALRGTTCESSDNGLCANSERWPLPVPIGVSVGHPAVTAGTIGARVTDGSNVFILSNNHVIAANNNAMLGDGILQPGTFDGGLDNADAIATLVDFEIIDFAADNTMDAAIALSTPAELAVSTPVGEFGSLVGYGVPSTELHPAYGVPEVIGDEDMAALLGTAVQKMGRTTGITSGSVSTIDASVSVCYDSPYCTQTATFVDQIIITPGTFAAGGDSGSLIVSDDLLNRGVGLLFAGSPTIVIANRIDLVLNRFGVRIDDGLGDNLRPVASFSTSPTPGTLTVQFDATASYDPDGTIAGYTWDFGDGTTGSGPIQTHSYLGPGSFNVRLVVIDDQGATGPAAETVTLDPIPGATCQFATCDNSYSGFVTEGQWSVSASSPGYYGSNYLHDGNDGKGAKTASWAYEIGADGNYEIAAQWSAWPNRSASVQYTYAVDGGPAVPCGAPVDQRSGGGQLNVLCLVTGLDAGSRLTVSLRNDAAGYVIADAVRVEADEGGPLPPVADFIASQVPDTLTVEFDASASADPDGAIVSYAWDFGDGTTGSGVAPSHSYANAGTYDVSLTVTGDFGATDTSTRPVGVQPVGGGNCLPGICDNSDFGFDLVGDWTISVSNPGFYGSNYLHDQNSGKGGKTASWTYQVAADGNYAVAAQWAAGYNRAADVQYMYSVDGGTPEPCGSPVDQRVDGGQFNGLCTVPTLTAGSELTVSLRNDSSTGYVIADAVRVELFEGGPLPPTAAFSASQVAGTLTVDFDASASQDPDGTIVSYAWDFGDGSTGSGLEPSYAYSAPGVYMVTLTVVGDFGSMDSETMPVTVQSVGGNACFTGICDNVDPGFASVGAWAVSAGSPGYYGSDYLHDQNSGKGSKTASWTFLLEADGNYEIAAQWASSGNRAWSVQYMYSVDGGPPANCGAPADQRRNGGQFNLLCVLPGLTAGSTLTISLRNDASRYVIADAVSATAQ